MHLGQFPVILTILSVSKPLNFNFGDDFDLFHLEAYKLAFDVKCRILTTLLEQIVFISAALLLHLKSHVNHFIFLKVFIIRNQYFNVDIRELLYNLE